jgi:NAD(P)-dependent dehydrogenase (short-subunit alcohol dehydrogenase family)
MRGAASRNATAADHLQRWALEHSSNLQILELDVISDTSVQQAVNQVLEAEGGIDVVVTNAGASAMGPLEAFDVDQMAALLNVNVLGPMRVNKAVLPTMRARRAGLIVWITSTLGRVLPGRGGLYPATKWAAEGFAESLHHQVRAFGIDVTIVEPGSFPTPATFKSMEAADRDIVAAYAALAPPANGAARPAAPEGYELPERRTSPTRCNGSSSCPPGSVRCGWWLAPCLPRALLSTTRRTSTCERIWRRFCGGPTRPLPGRGGKAR